MTYEFKHEALDCYRLALEVHRALRARTWPVGMGTVKDQGLRASASAVLNIAEADGRKGKARLNHLRIALGSVNETAAVVDIAFGGDPAVKEPLGRCALMLAGLLRKG